MNTYYISPAGSDSNNGSINSPWKSWSKGASPLLAGDVLYFRAGTHPMSGSQSLSNKQGTAAANILIAAYPGEKVVFDWGGVAPSSQVRGIHLNNCAFIIIKGIRVTNLPQRQAQGSYNYGFSLWNNNKNCTVDNCEADHIGGSGFHAGPGSDNNTFINCDSHHNGDQFSSPAYENSNGFEFGGTDMGDNVKCINCRAWWNGDDGFDSFNSPNMASYIGCWSFWNGYVPGTFNTGGNGQGFKIGQVQSKINSVKRLYQNCVAYKNRKFGFDQNFTDANHSCQVTLYNNTSYKNGDCGFWLTQPVAHTLKNNISYGNGGGMKEPSTISTLANSSNNSWNFTVTDADFLSVDPTGIDGPRQPDGSLPNLPFLRLAPTSGLINKGVPVGLPYAGTAPDLGAFESGTVVTPPPTNYANAEQSVTLTRNNCVLPAVGSSVKYTVPAGKYSSTVSQADADSKASADLTANGQSYANTNGTCNISGPTVVQTFRRNGVTYTLLSDHTWH